MAFPQLAHPQPQRIRFASPAFTGVPTVSATNFISNDTNFMNTTLTAANQSSDSLSVNLSFFSSNTSTSSISSYYQSRTDEFGSPLGRRRSPYPTRKICDVDWSPLSNPDSDGDEECDSHCDWECKCKLPPNSISSTRSTVKWAQLPVRDVGGELSRVPTPYPHDCAQPKDTRRGMRRWVRAVKRVLRLGKRRGHGNERHICLDKNEEENKGGKEEERRRSGSGSSGSKYERSIRAVFGEEPAVYDGGCGLKKPTGRK